MILVTGGAGHIGSVCVSRLLDIGEKVLVVDNLITGQESRIDNRAKFYNGDIRDTIFLRRIFAENDIEGVIHFAAYTSIEDSMKKPLFFYDNNVYGTERLLQVMSDHDCKIIVFSSSADIYDSNQSLITEESIKEPTSAYGQTMLAIENMLKWTDKVHGIKYTALRYFNSYKKLTPLILEDHPITISSGHKTVDGSYVRDYVHVDDIVNGHILAFTRLRGGRRSDVYNLGGYIYSMKEVLETLAKYKKVTFNEGETESDVDVLTLSKDKAYQGLGWEPKHDINEIIKSIIDRKYYEYK